MAELIVIKSGAGQSGPAGTAGPPGSSAGTPAPNVLSTSTAAVYFEQYDGINLKFGFQGRIDLPTFDPDYAAHFKRVDVVAVDAAGGGHVVQSFTGAAITGTSITYKGIIGIQQLAPAPDETWAVVFIPYNEGGAPTASPFLRSGLAVYAAALTSCAGSELAGSHYQDRLQGLHFALQLSVVIAHAQTPFTVTFAVDYDDGNGWVGQGPFAISGGAGSVIIGQPEAGTNEPGTIWVPKPGRGAWKVACWPGAQPLPSGTVLPSGAVTNTFSVTPVGVGSSSDLTNAVFLTNPASGDQMTYALGNPGVWTWNYYQLQVQQPTMASAPFYWFCFLAVQKGHVASGVWVPATDSEGADEQPALYKGRWTSDSGQFQGGVTSSPGTIVTFVGNSPPDWTFPLANNPDGSVNLDRTFRFWLYTVSHANDSVPETGSSPVPFVLTTPWPGGADHFDLTPTPKPAALDLTQANSSTFGDYLGGGGGVKPFVKIAGPIYGDVAGNINLRIGSDYVISGTGTTGDPYKLSQAIIDLTKAVGFDATGFEKRSGGSGPQTMFIKNVAVDQLIAGNALFAGDATFAVIGGGKVTINSAGMACGKVGAFAATLNSSIGPGFTGPVPVSNTSIANGGYLMMGTEIVLVTAGGGTTSLFLARAQLATVAPSVQASGTSIFSYNTMVATSAGVAICSSAGSIAMVAGGIQIIEALGGSVTITGAGGVVIQKGPNIITIPPSGGIVIQNGSVNTMTIAASFIAMTGLLTVSDASGTSSIDSSGLSVLNNAGFKGKLTPSALFLNNGGGYGQVLTGTLTGPGNTTGTLADITTRFNNLLAALRTHGLIS